MNGKVFLTAVILITLAVSSAPNALCAIDFLGNRFACGNLKDVVEEGDLVYGISDDFLFIWKKPSPSDPSREIHLLSATRVDAQAVDNWLMQLVVHDRRAYIQVWWHVMAYDVSNPEKPVFLSRFEAEDYSFGAIAARGDYLYAGCHHYQIDVISYADPRNPVVVNTVTSPYSFTNGMAIVDGYLLATCPNWVTYETTVYSLEDPVNPRWESSAPYCFRPDDRVGRYLYGHGRAHNGTTYVQTLRKVDAEALPDLVTVASVDFEEDFEGVAFDGRFAYVMRHEKEAAIYVDLSSVEMWDMGDWSDPRLVCAVRTESTIHDGECDGGWLFAADGIRGLKAWPLRSASQFPPKPYTDRFLLEPLDVALYDHYAFHVCENRWSINQTYIEPQSEIHIVDITDPVKPRRIDTVVEKDIIDVADAKYWQGHLYLLGEGLLSVYRVLPLDPPALEKIACHKVDNDMSMTFHGDTLMIAGLFTDVDFYDIREPARIEYLSTYSTGVYCPCYWEGQASDDYLYQPWGSDAGGSIHGYGVKVVDISNPRIPVEVHDVNFEFGRMEMARSGRYLYSAHWQTITVIDIREPEEAFIAAEHTPPNDGYVWKATATEDTLLLGGDYSVGWYSQPCVIRADISRPPEILSMKHADTSQRILGLTAPTDDLLYSVELDSLSLFKFANP